MFGLERGRAAMRIGETKPGRAAYEFVARAWLHADPELQPLVAESRQGAR